MARSRSDLPRNPRTSGLVPAVRSSHRGYQSFGNTALNVVRAASRDLSVYAVHVELERLGARLTHDPAEHPTHGQYVPAKSQLLASYPKDVQLRGDARRVRYNPAGPPPIDDLVLTVVIATREFRREIDASTRLGRRAKRRARAQAWTRLHAVLSGVELALLAIDHPNISSLVTVARGSLR
jgi:hypothetical protein